MWHVLHGAIQGTLGVAHHAVQGFYGLLHGKRVAAEDETVEARDKVEILGVGGVLTVYMAHNRKIGSSNIVGALLIPCTCLLYTSPSPRDQRGSRMPSSA